MESLLTISASFGRLFADCADGVSRSAIAAILDVFSRRVIDWALDRKLDRNLNRNLDCNLEDAWLCAAQAVCGAGRQYG